ncbi:hypothetical protein J3R30DRAFT_694106 [Lentinula aciculospora]|uniref:Uncharacterized protein n=1 Tax=Lentinula aciculospora TaxID=153920 RepID=A0A9W9A4U7_9AGAR|nr:hypothetical protein J3R30DRAFT_694106 [Lentinula aciculospora]
MRYCQSSRAFSLLFLVSVLLGTIAIPVTLKESARQLEQRTPKDDPTHYPLAIHLLKTKNLAWLFVGPSDCFHATIVSKEDEIRLQSKRVPRNKFVNNAEVISFKAYAKFSQSDTQLGDLKTKFESINGATTNWEFIFKAMEWLIKEGVVWEDVDGEEQKVTQIPKDFEELRKAKPVGAGGATLTGSEVRLFFTGGTNTNRNWMLNIGEMRSFGVKRETVRGKVSFSFQNISETITEGRFYPLQFFVHNQDPRTLSAVYKKITDLSLSPAKDRGELNFVMKAVNVLREQNVLFDSGGQLVRRDVLDAKWKEMKNSLTKARRTRGKWNVERIKANQRGTKFKVGKAWVQT